MTLLALQVSNRHPVRKSYRESQFPLGPAFSPNLVPAFFQSHPAELHTAHRSLRLVRVAAAPSDPPSRSRSAAAPLATPTLSAPCTPATAPPPTGAALPH